MTDSGNLLPSGVEYQANPSELRDALAQATRATAAAMSALSRELDLQLAERELQEVFVVALRRSLAPLKLKVKQNHKVDFVQWQPCVGPVDVALGATGEATPPSAFLELKWGSGTLYNCVWDIEKMAVAVAGGYTRRAFLLAGAPITDWQSAEGHELFSISNWQTVDLLETYAHRWKFWRCDVKTRPQSLPADIHTTTVSQAAMIIKGSPWSLNCVEVTAAADTRWLDVPK